MELLKKITLTAIAVIFTANVYSQTTTEIQAAFTLSYTHEKNGEYAKAIDEMNKKGAKNITITDLPEA